MKLSNKISILGVALSVLLFGQTLDVWGAALLTPGEGPLSCRVENPGNGALAIRGTVAVEVMYSKDPYTDEIVNPQEADFTLRLERSGEQHFFRLHYVGIVAGLSNKEMTCLMLDANPLDTNGNDILRAFGIPDGWRLVITDNSISETDPETQKLGGGKLPGSYRISNIADIVIYAVKP